jgi:ABC-type glycerol-3-phosphate transport system permease component
MRCAFRKPSASPYDDRWRILLPLARLGILSAALLSFTMVWNEFLVAQAMRH